MLLVAPVKEEIRSSISKEDQEIMTQPDLLKRVSLKKDRLSLLLLMLTTLPEYKVFQKVEMNATIAL